MRGFVLGKSAADLDQALARREASGAPGRTTGRLVAGGNGWSVEDVLCTCGPGDRPFEERHTAMSIGVVVCGTFQYRSPLGRDLMTPGSFLLGNAGQCFECGHEHAAGDRCVALRYAPDYFDRLAADAGAPSGERRFRASRLPPVRALSGLVARAAAGVVGSIDVSWERSEEHTSELQSHSDLVCRLLLEKKKKKYRKFRVRKNEKYKKMRSRSITRIALNSTTEKSKYVRTSKITKIELDQLRSRTTCMYE